MPSTIQSASSLSLAGPSSPARQTRRTQEIFLKRVLSPIEASSGQTTRHRLNRGGDRALNRALHTIAMIRMSRCPTTRAYVERRRAYGKNTAEIRRCLKRYIARRLHRQLTATMSRLDNR